MRTATETLYISTNIQSHSNFLQSTIILETHSEQEYTVLFLSSVYSERNASFCYRENDNLMSNLLADDDAELTSALLIGEGKSSEDDKEIVDIGSNAHERTSSLSGKLSDEERPSPLSPSQLRRQSTAISLGEGS